MRTARVGLLILLLVVLTPAPTRAGDLETVLALEKSFSEAVAKVRPTVVSIFATFAKERPAAGKDGPAGKAGKDGKATPRRLSPVLPRLPESRRTRERALAGSGSGVLISSDGLILTNHHVAGEAKTVSVLMADGVRKPGVIVGTDPRGDLALLKIDGKDLPYARLGPDDQPRPGAWVLAMGNPFTLATHDGAPIVTQGIVSGLHRIQAGARDGSLFYGDALQTDAEINPGNSGGPLFDLSGRLVGINGRIATRGRLYKINTGVGFAVSVRQVRRMLPRLKAGGTVRHGFLGVRYDVDERNQAGIEIRYVYPDSPAAVAGLAAGERILAVDGARVTTGSRLAGILSTLPEGASSKLVVSRKGKERLVTVSLVSRPAGAAR